MTSITPIPSECKLEVFLGYEVFTINSEQIYERQYIGKNIIWIPTFKSEDPKEQAIYDKFRRCTYTYNGEEAVWYMGENKINFAPKIENWYQNYLKSRTIPKYVRFLKFQAAQSQSKRYIPEDFLSVFRRIPESVVSDYVRLIAKSQNHEN